MAEHTPWSKDQRIESVESAHIALEGARLSLQEAKEALQHATETVKASERDLSNAKVRVARAEHHAAGKCIDSVTEGSTWHRYDRPCESKAQTDSLYCGAHNRKRQRDAEYKRWNVPYVR